MRVLIYTLLLILASCSNCMDEISEIKAFDERSVTNALYNDDSEDFMNAKQLIDCMGYDATKINDRGEYYLVADKYRFYKDDISAFLLENPNYASTRVATSGNDTLGVHYRKINISAVHDSYGCNGISHISSAITYWNDVGCDIQFNTEVGSNEHPDFPFNVTVEFAKLYGNELIVLDKNKDYAEKIYDNIVIDISNYLWSKIETAGKIEELVTHALGEAIGLKNIEPSDVNEYMSTRNGDLSIMFSPKVIGMGSHWDNLLWSAGISSTDKIDLQRMYPSTAITNYTLSWKDNQGNVLNDTDFLVNNSYTLSFENSSSCCVGDTKHIEIYDENNSLIDTKTTSDSSVELYFDKAGNYTMKFYVVVAGLDIGLQHEQVIEFKVKNGFIINEIEQIALNTPYTICYEYDKTELSAPTITWSANEYIFNTPTEDQFTLVSMGDSFNITLHKNGCYFVQGIVKDAGIPIDTVYCNITKMERLPSTVNIWKSGGRNHEYTPYGDDENSISSYSSSVIASYQYTMQFPSVGSMSGRFGCLVESEYENRYSYEDEFASRRVNREWYMRLHPITSLNLSSNTEFPLETLYWSQSSGEEYAASGLLWRYEYYTGYVYCPLDGIREANDTKLHRLPRERIIATIEGGEERIGYRYE